MVNWARSNPRQGASLGLGVIVAAAIFVSAFNALRPPAAQILAPATVPSLASLCTVPLTTGKGSISPVFCSDGSINTTAWKALAQARPGVMKLGRHAKPSDVRQAIAVDMKAGMLANIECSAALVSAAYYGWNFHIDPVAGLGLDCPILK